MFDTNKMEINAAFYELFESVFGEDFFSILVSMRPTPRISHLRSKKLEELTSEEQEEVLKFNASVASKMNKYSPRIAYIGTKLYNKQYGGSYQDYLAFLASCDASAFLNQETIKAIWEKISLDQAVPKSAKNA